jgi:hypothetical protein
MARALFFSRSRRCRDCGDIALTSNHGIVLQWHWSRAAAIAIRASHVSPQRNADASSHRNRIAAMRMRTTLARASASLATHSQASIHGRFCKH